MSVVGFDVGSSTCFVAVARQGGIDTVANEFSARATPSYVSFGENQRELGTSAQQKTVMNLKNTVWLFKHLIGRPFDDIVVKRYQPLLPYQLVQIKETGRCGIKVEHCGQEYTFSMEQVLAMLLGKLKTIAESNLEGRAVYDCVITCPFYLTNTERSAWLEAAKIAQLNPLRLMNETSAVALAYGIFKTDLPEAGQEPRRIAFVDVGYTQTQVCIAALNKGSLKITCINGDKNLGGLDLDLILVDHFAKEFKERYKIDVKTNKRAELRLFQACEKLKKQMSANATIMSMHIECIMDDKDVSGKMAREEFESKIKEAGLFDKLRTVLADCKAQLKDQKIDSVEMIGGSSRVPFIKEIISEVFGTTPTTTLNADEAVARGAALQCAILSPSFRVREFALSDAQPYPIRIDWSGSDGKPGNALLFDTNESIPLSKVLTFTRKDTSNFKIKASYHKDDFSYYPDRFIADYEAQGIKSPTIIPNEAEPTSIKVKVKLRIDANGQLIVPQAVQIDRQLVEVPAEAAKAKPEAKSPEKTPPADTSKPTEESPPTDAKSKTEEPEKAEKMEVDATPEVAAPAVVKQAKAVKIDLPIQTMINGALNPALLDQYCQQEAELIVLDKKERDRQNAKNDVEEFVYSAREKMSVGYKEFATQTEQDSISSSLQTTEDWLYEDGFDEKRQAYVDRLDQLKNDVAPIIKRYNEFYSQKPALEKLAQQITKVEKFMASVEANDEAVEHIDKEKVKKVKKSLKEQREWYDKSMNALLKVKKTDDPVILTSQISDKTHKLKQDCDSTMDTPKPKPPPSPPKEDASKSSEEKPSNTEGTTNPDEKKEEKQEAGEATPDRLRKLMVK